MDNITREEYEDMFVGMIPANTDEEGMKKFVEHDPVNHPSHYCYGKIEPIDFIIDKNLDFCRGNAIKYIVRAGKKEGAPVKEDIKKAIFYLNAYIKNMED